MTITDGGAGGGMTVTISGTPGPERCCEQIFHLWSWIECVRPKHHLGKHATFVGLTPTVIEWGENVVPASMDLEESMLSQIGRLADFIMNEVPGEPSQSEGSVDVAIRLLRCYVRERQAMVPAKEAMVHAKHGVEKNVEEDRPFNPLRVK